MTFESKIIHYSIVKHSSWVERRFQFAVSSNPIKGEERWFVKPTESTKPRSGDIF